MPPVPINKIIEWCGITTARVRTQMIAELFTAPEGLFHLVDETNEGLQSAFREYSRRDKADGKIIFTRVQQKRLISLMDWVKDRARLNEIIEFEGDTNRVEFIADIEAASERKKCRGEQKKTGESLITTTFQVQLETASQWDRWYVELESNLKMIIGAKGIALSYVIREDNDPDLSEQETWELKATLGAPHEGPSFANDALTVHNIIIRNIADGSDAFTYVKPLIKKDNGRLDVQALRSRYDNTAMHEQYVSEAKRTLDTITYRNERAMKFEKFVGQFVKAVDDLEKYKRKMHNEDIVDLIWKKMTNPDLSQYVMAIKVQFQREPREYQAILQDIASQVPNLRIDSFRKASEVTRQDKSTERCPESGAYDATGKLYTGQYPFKKWVSESVRPHWNEIREVRSQGGGGSEPTNKRFQSQLKKKKELEHTISELSSKKARVEASISAITSTDGSATTVSTLGKSQAGNSFGGRSEKASQK